ncbi:MAG: sigma-70 family RNA polymerase sigma factor [Candidatus Liptonbacteria bacterium]|nr:sigma-70 family RNA polymerase sigma factor [Candidatus Liptonbacteria bacterium]
MDGTQDKAFRNQIGSFSLSGIDGEERIVRSAVKGEASSFGLLYDYYQPKIYRFVIIKVGKREEAEDLTHQVFLNAWQNIRSYKHHGFPFSSWLYQIARNEVIDFYRTRKYESRLDYLDENYFISPASAEFKFDQGLEMERVKLAMKQMKPDYQDVIIMRFVEEIPIKEVALAIGKSEGAVKLIQHRALKELKKILS